MIAVEQYYLAACIEYHRHNAASPYHGVKIEYLIASAADLFDPDRARQTGFTHLIAGAKKHPELANRLKRRVQRDYSEYYERCIKLGCSV